MSAPVFVRTASIRDLLAVQKLLLETWHATYDDIYGAEKVDQICAEWHSLEALETKLKAPNSEFIVADDSKAILGMAYASQQQKTVKLHQLYVIPDQQGRHIGKDLLQEIFFCFDGADTIELEVDEANKNAVRFYHLAGFEVTGKTRNCGHETSQIPALIMSRSLEY